MANEEVIDQGSSAIELDRSAVEKAMSIYDELGRKGFSERYPTFASPREFWVRPSRQRKYPAYPSKAIAAIARGVTSINGGWSQPLSAGALLHNTGYLIVDEQGQLHPVPLDQYAHLISGANWIRAYALTNYIGPARERGDATVSITSGTLHKELGLKQNLPNVCQVLRGKIFLEYASVPPPEQQGPDNGSTTRFTFNLTSKVSKMLQPTQTATNLILYGPPGTGKTYRTALEAVQLCLGADEMGQLLEAGGRQRLMETYRRLVAEKRIEFVTFHQSYSYEEFVEGLRPTTEPSDSSQDDDESDGLVPATGGFRLATKDGIFKRICERAHLDTGSDTDKMHLDRQRPIFKMALGQKRVEEDRIAEGLDNGLIHLGWGGKIDWSDSRFDSGPEVRKEWEAQNYPIGSGREANVEMLFAFRSQMRVGDYVVLSDGRDYVRAFGRVTGEYYFDESADYHPHRRKVEWIWINPEGALRAKFYPNYFRRQTIYRLNTTLVNWDALEELVLGDKAISPAATAKPYVLVIDEINRANISKVFGELITLLETDKRLGCVNEIKVTLPYSNQEFGVPPNLHIIGTMNTADRSIALLDTALRRRFEFQELMPDPKVLKTVDGIDLATVLNTINERIEYLFDREHQIGHAYFIGCDSREQVDNVMRHKVIPLLAEYFYEDWSKVAAILGDANQGERGRKPGFLDRRKLVAPPGLDADGDERVRYAWSVQDNFDYSGLLKP